MKRTKAQLLLEELGCPHRWGYAIPSSVMMYCLDCHKPRVQIKKGPLPVFDQAGALLLLEVLPKLTENHHEQQGVQ